MERGKTRGGCMCTCVMNGNLVECVCVCMCMKVFNIEKQSWDIQGLIQHEGNLLNHIWVILV